MQINTPNKMTRLSDQKKDAILCCQQKTHFKFHIQIFFSAISPVDIQ